MQFLTLWANVQCPLYSLPHTHGGTPSMFCLFQELGERVRFLRYVVCHVTLMYCGKTLFLAERRDKTTDWNVSSRYISQLVWTIKTDSWFDSCCSASFTESQSSFLTDEKCISLYDCHLRQWFLQKAISFPNRLHQILSVPNQDLRKILSKYAY